LAGDAVPLFAQGAVVEAVPVDLGEALFGDLLLQLGDLGDVRLEIGAGLARLLDRTRLITLPVDVYFIPYVPFDVRPRDVALVALLSVVVSFLATLYPSWRAAQLDPSEALRYE